MSDNPHYVTPEEAEKMGCPTSMNRPEFAASCIGKTCMAWRWRPAGHQDMMRGLGLPLPLVPEEPMTHGYCGMIRS
jgi:hypothetical protein